MGFKVVISRFWEAQDTPPNYFNIPVEVTTYYFLGLRVWSRRYELKPEEVYTRRGWQV